MSNIPERFSEAYKSEDLVNISVDLIESVLKNDLTSEIAKETPIVKYLFAVKNFITSFSDRVFVKKAFYVLHEIKNVGEKERQEFISELEDRYVSGNEIILMTIDKIESVQKSVVFGRLCVLRAEMKISLDDFKRLTKVIQDSYLDDLHLIAKFETPIKNDEVRKTYYSLVNLGLIAQFTMTEREWELLYEPERNNNFRQMTPVPPKPERIKFELTTLGQVLVANYSFLLGTIR